MPRAKMAPVYIGDVGEIPLKESGNINLLNNVDLESLSYQELCALALQVGLDIRDIIGVKTCSEHFGMILLADQELPAGYSLFADCNYCRNCFQWFRINKG